MDTNEKKRYTFLQALNTIRNDKVAKRQESKEKSLKEKEKLNAGREAKFEAARKANLKRKYRAEGKKDAARQWKKTRGE
jgi:ribosome biogenesis protein BMS1